MKGQEFVLDSQIKVLKDQIQKLKNTETDYKEESRETTGALQQTTKENNRNEMMLEGDLRQLNDATNQAETTHFEHKLHQEREVAFDKLGGERHDLEVKLVTALKDKKEAELAQCRKDLEQIEKDFLAKTDYQNALKETAQLLDEIEDAKVKTQTLEIQVTLLSEQTEALNGKREDLIEEKKLADAKNEEFKTQFKAQEEIAKKRLQNKLNREKSETIKNLLGNEEMAKQACEDIQNKCRSEKENFDGLLRDKMDIEERLERKTKELEEDTATVDKQEELLAELKKQIEAEQAAVDEIEEDVVAQRKTKVTESERNRRVQQEHTALDAKKVFIEENYDYTSNVSDMNLDIFKRIVESNNDVNETVNGFVGKVSGTKKEVQQILATRINI